MKRERQDKGTVSSSLLLDLLDQSKDAFIAVRAQDGRIIFMNEQACRYLDRPKNTLIDHSIVNCLAALQSADWSTIVENCRRTKQTVFETELANSQSDRLLEVSVSYIESGNESYLVATVRDISSRRWIESALVSSEHRFRNLVEHSVLGIFLIQQGLMVYVNPFLEQLFGYETGELINKPVADLVHPEDLPKVQDRLCHREAGRSLKAHYEFRARRKNGQFFPVEVYDCKIEDEGEPAIIGTLLDVSDRKKVADALRESEERLRLSQAYGGIGTWEADIINDRQIWSEECVTLHGFPRLQHPTWNDFIGAVHPEDRQMIIAASNDHLQFGKPYDVEYRTTSDKGKIRWLRSVGHAERDAEGNPIRMLGIVQDITLLHQAFEELRQSETRLKEAQHLAQVGNWELELENHQFSCSDEVFRIFEIDQEQTTMTFETFLEAIHPEDRDEFECKYLNSVAERTHLNFDHRLRMPDGRIKHIHEQCETFHDLSGKPLRTLGTVQDITDREQTEAERQYFYNTLNASLNELYMFNASTLLFEFVSQGALKNLGYSMAEMRQMTPLDIKPHFKQESFAKMLKPLVDGELPVLHFETEHLRADGSLYPVEVHLQMIDQVEHRVFLAVILDITQRKLAEKKLRENEERLRLTLKAAQQGWYDLNIRTGETTVSAEYAEILGYRPENFTENVNKWLERMHPADRSAVLSKFHAYTQGLAPEYRVEFRQRTRSGHWKWILSIGSIVERNEQGEALRMLGTHRDITQRKMAELAVRKLNEELEARVLERTEQLQAANQELETFTYTVSHDLKAPLRGIDGYSRLLQEDHKDKFDSECSQFIENIRRGVRQMNELIEDLLAYSRVERRMLKTVPIQVAELIEHVKLEKQTELKAVGSLFNVNLPEGLTVQADLNGLLMVLRNLFDNALKFSRDAKPPSLEVGGRMDGKSCVIWFRDNGIGFDMKFHDRIFDIFQRLERAENYPGTGIGLTIARKAMVRMGGRIWAESTPGQGATFYLELPL